MTAFVLCLLAALGARAGEPEAKILKYPDDLQEFRKKALKYDGAFAPDIAFLLRTCPKCRNLYVYGTFPRLKRQPFDSLAAVHDTIEAAALRQPPPKTMFSPKAGRQVPRACPVCGEAENGARADRVLFCHRMPESGDDMQIEYAIANGKVSGARAYWRMTAAPAGRDAGATVHSVKLADESEDEIKKAFGHHFSLRAVWTKIFATRMDSQQPYYEQVGPGMWFVFRPGKVEPEKFKEFGDTILKADRDKGVFDRLESPFMLDESRRQYGSYQDWAGAYAERLASGEAEPYVAISYPALRKAAQEIMATRTVVLELLPVEKPSLPGLARIKGSDYYTEISFGPLAREAAIAGLSLHHAAALYLTEPTFAVEAAMRLDAALRARYPHCVFRVEEGRKLVLKDSAGEERGVEVLALCERLDPENAFMFDLYCTMMLAWDERKNGFGPKPLQRDVSPTGLPAFIEKRIRPAGHLASQNASNALHETREDSDGNRYDLCYTSECSVSLVYLNPVLERFKDLTLEEAQRIYGVTGGILPQYITAQDALSFPGDALEKAGPCKALMVCGLDLSSLAADAGRASKLALLAGFSGEEERIHIYAPTTNCAILAPRKLTGEELKLARSRLKALAAEALPEPGLELNLHFDLPRAEPRGTVLRRK